MFGTLRVDRMAEEEKIITIGNIEINKKENFILLTINPKIYPLEVIYSAAYVFLDKAYIILFGDPESEVFIEMRFKSNKGDLETLGRDFNNELINYAVYKTQLEQSSEINSEIVQKALETNSSDEDQDLSDEDYTDDPLDIAKPWEETHKNERNED
jgi:His-Xaa-Ser system protein HxsD